MAANKVELVFNWKPQHLNLWPVRHYESICDQDSRHILVFDNLSPKEEIDIEIMSINADLSALIQVRSAECQAKNVPMMWIAYVAPWKIAITRAFLFLGLGAFVYWLLHIAAKKITCYRSKRPPMLFWQRLLIGQSRPCFQVKIKVDNSQPRPTND